MKLFLTWLALHGQTGSLLTYGPPSMMVWFMTQFFISWMSSIVSSVRECRCEETESFPKLKDLSQSDAIAGTANKSKARAASRGKASLWSAHQRIGLIVIVGRFSR